MAVRRCTSPLRVGALLRLPADSLSPGASPAQAASRAAVANRVKTKGNPESKAQPAGMRYQQSPNPARTRHDCCNGRLPKTRRCEPIGRTRHPPYHPAPERMSCEHGLTYAYCSSRHSYSAGRKLFEPKIPCRAPGKTGSVLELPVHPPPPGALLLRRLGPGGPRVWRSPRSDTLVLACSSADERTGAETARFIMHRGQVDVEVGVVALIRWVRARR